MLPNCKTRIESTLEDLQNFMSENDENEELKNNAEWQAAEQVLAEALAYIETI